MSWSPRILPRKWRSIWKGINGVNYGMGRKFPPPDSMMLLNYLCGLLSGSVSQVSSGNTCFSLCLNLARLLMWWVGNQFPCKIRTKRTQARVRLVRHF